jgi:hypothetical protein
MQPATQIDQSDRNAGENSRAIVLERSVMADACGSEILDRGLLSHSRALAFAELDRRWGRELE